MSSDEVEVEACDWSTLKKKKKKPLQPPAPPPSEEPSDVEADYTYLDLLQRLYRSHREQHPEAATATTAPLHLPLPRLARQGGKHMVLLNFGAICQQLQRGLPHVQAFLEAEASTVTSINAHEGLVLRGRFTVPQLESLLRQYVLTYVRCSNCHHCHTMLSKDATVRLWFVQCCTCQARHSVPSLKI